MKPRIAQEAIPNTLKSCSSNQDLRSMGLQQRDSLMESKVGVLIECSNKDGKKVHKL
jgi:hypothetical protein